MFISIYHQNNHKVRIYIRDYVVNIHPHILAKTIHISRYLAQQQAFNPSNCLFE